ncbi:ankyrin repeat-containing domain, PGG domain protein [Artemisia annua]|uniref:Ankyrin repeat-containing domain, PGG domain protein n=1 Tax=Artemisia annua TaxID=35608 RepID=A0A2U1NE05_ARTAN|nr:ankyrin repeat-containing domain, PGG domain protein [Artemisia annua]
MGNTNFLVELIRRSPGLIWKVDDNNQTIFHIAVKHRHEGIYKLLYEIGSMKDMITPLIDEHGNNMLHLVGKTAKKHQLEDVSGVALQMQRELLWFQEVSKMIPPSYKQRKNDDDLTPHELFTKEHKELVTQGEKWMKGTANQCMVVAALIATIVFAAAFTVPGGYNQDNATMTLAFGASFFVLYQKGFLWIPILIGVFALLPVILYLCLQYGLFLDIIRSTYASRYLFKPKKHVLYYQNPKYFYIKIKKKGWLSFGARSKETCYVEPLDSLKSWQDRFFWVDSFACPSLFSICTATIVPKDKPPEASEHNADDVTVLLTNQTPFLRFYKIHHNRLLIYAYY